VIKIICKKLILLHFYYKKLILFKKRVTSKLALKNLFIIKMPQKHKKKPQELQVFRLVFTSAKNLKVTASTLAQVNPILQNTSNLISSLKEKLDFYR